MFGTCKPHTFFSYSIIHMWESYQFSHLNLSKTLDTRISLSLNYSFLISLIPVSVFPKHTCRPTWTWDPLFSHTSHKLLTAWSIREAACSSSHEDAAYMQWHTVVVEVVDCIWNGQRCISVSVVWQQQSVGSVEGFLLPFRCQRGEVAPGVLVLLYSLKKRLEVSCPKALEREQTHTDG